MAQLSLKEPVNLNPLIGIVLQTLPEINAALEDQELTVDELIDIMAAAARAAARTAGVSDRVIATTRTE